MTSYKVDFEMKTDASAFPKSLLHLPSFSLESYSPSSFLGPSSIILKCPILLNLDDNQHLIKREMVIY